MAWDPFEEIRRMHEEMDRLFGRIFTGKMLPYGKGKELAKYSGFRMPVAEIRETENSIIATLELPGVDKKDIDLNVTESSVEVKVESKAEKEVKGKGKYSYEAKSQQFYRRLPLPAEVKAGDAEAEYKDGILKVEIPRVKKLESKKKKIDIK
ncbi:Hsp20/alpha crystallin family protein [Candidatus Woesearchaeota archaeon]|nr:Hsp20/alpha crystallin family protein [Candidatus Woesearchaeota archaeon]